MYNFFIQVCFSGRVIVWFAITVQLLADVMHTQPCGGMRGRCIDMFHMENIDITCFIIWYAAFWRHRICINSHLVGNYRLKIDMKNCILYCTAFWRHRIYFNILLLEKIWKRYWCYKFYMCLAIFIVICVVAVVTDILMSVFMGCPLFHCVFSLCLWM